MAMPADGGAAGAEAKDLVGSWNMDHMLFVVLFSSLPFFLCGKTTSSFHMTMVSSSSAAS